MKLTILSLLVIVLTGTHSAEILFAEDRFLDREFPKHQEILVAAHRGGYENEIEDKAPENSLINIDNAVRRGFDIYESDIRRTKDGVFVVMHDETIDRTTNGKGKVTELTVEQLKPFRLKLSNGTITDEKISTVEEFLKRGNGRIVFKFDFKVELKHLPEFAEQIDKWKAKKNVLLRFGFKKDLFPVLNSIPKQKRPQVLIRVKKLWQYEALKKNLDEYHVSINTGNELKYTDEQLKIIDVASKAGEVIESHSFGDRLKNREEYWAKQIKLPITIFHTKKPILFKEFVSNRNSKNNVQLSRGNLLQFLDSKGNIKAVQSIDDWGKRRSNVVAAMQSIMGKLPGMEKRCPLNVKVLEEIELENHVRRLIEYQSEPDAPPVPAYLSIPKRVLDGNSKAYAVLCLHPTDNTVGHKVVVGLGGKPRRLYAKELAERGFVTLAPAYPLLANYQPNWRNLRYESGTMKAIWDNIRGIDYLMSLPYVKKEGVGAIGHSLGGHNSVYSAVFDERIKVVVSSCGLDSYFDYKNGNLTGWTGDRYMPKLAKFKNNLDNIPFDFNEILASLAPRPVFISAPLHDSNFQWKSVDRVVNSAKEVYTLYEKPKAIKVVHPDCPHDFPDEIREQAYQWIEAVLN